MRINWGRIGGTMRFRFAVSWFHATYQGAHRELKTGGSVLVELGFGKRGYYLSLGGK